MESSELSDQERVARILEGDTALGDELVERMQHVVSKIIRARVTRQSDERDLTQTVLLNVFASLDQYSGAAPLEHWVSRIAVNVSSSAWMRGRATQMFFLHNSQTWKSEFTCATGMHVPEQVNARFACPDRLGDQGRTAMRVCFRRHVVRQ